MTGKSVASRFLQITLVGYFVAIVSVGLAVWFASAPALKEMQRDAKRAHLQTKAFVLSKLVDDFSDEARYLAQNPEIVSLVMGQTNNDSIVSDTLASNTRLQNMRLFDYRGRVIIQQRFGGARSPFMNAEAVEGLSKMKDGKNASVVRVKYRPADGYHQATFLFATPIVSFGLVEGLLVFEVALDLVNVLQANDSSPRSMLLTPFQVREWAEWYGDNIDLESIPVPGTDFFVGADADQEVARLVGRQLVLTVIGVAVIALLLPFALMALSGMKAIVRPHRDLVKSQLILKENQSELAAAKAETEYQALHDPLTGLPNRRFLDRVLAAEVTDQSPPRVLVRIDLDFFKNVNDTLGHAAGDFVLCQVADILRSLKGTNDCAVRVGGDEFVLLLATEVDHAAAFDLTERMRSKIAEDMNFEGKTCRVGASFGIASADAEIVSNEALLKSADSALYLAKDSGRNKTVHYSPDVHGKVMAKRTLSKEIENGIRRNEFTAHFQPQFSAATEELVGIEALVRWNHPTRGVLAPAEFLDVAKQLKTLPQIDSQVFEYGLDCVAKLNIERLFVPKISFNVDVQRLVDPGLEDLIWQKDIGFTRVSLEVLESVIVEDQESGFFDRIRHLRKNDIGIELDDFGSGHASVVGLQKLKPDIMKLDQRLVSPVHESETARTLARCMIDIGKALGISVTAEGVETAEHARIMRDLGCDAFQGYYFARPMPFEDLRNLMKSSRIGDPGKVALGIQQVR